MGVYTRSSSPTRKRPSSGPYFTNLDGPVFALVNLPEVVKGALFAAVLALGQEPPPPVPRRVRRRPRPHRRPHRRRHHRPAARRGALRARVPRVRRRLRRAARRRAPRVRAVVEPAHQDPRVGSAHGLPRAVDALHPVRRQARWPLPLLPRLRGARRPRARRGATSPTWTRCSRPTRRCCPTLRRLGARALPEGSRRLPLRLQADHQGEGVRRRPRHPPRRDAVERRHLRHRPGVRGAAAAHACAPAARGPQLRGH